MNYAVLVKRIRDQLFLSQTDLANLLGVTFATVNRWENEHFKPSIRDRKKLYLLCKKSHIPYEDCDNED